ncbi:MAG: TIGR00725 family protein [Candidatus Omnitrophica bacterium]|nr:TIGR00725 family protein [Candidatus Omnitrophota bacterium]
MNITVIGGHSCSKENYNFAYELGKLIAKEGWILISGGKEGVMEAVCRGAKEQGGLTVGILPGYDQKEANDYVDIKLPTGLGYARNVLVVRASDVVIAVSGEYGTLSEVGFALSEKKIVIGIDSWDIKGVIKVKTPQAAIAQVKKELDVK